MRPKSIATRGGLIYSIVMNRTPGTAKFIAKLGTPTRRSNLFEIFRESMHTMRCLHNKFPIKQQQDVEFLGDDGA
jgi:hypothetical protein